MADVKWSGTDYGVKDKDGNWIASVSTDERDNLGGYKWNEGQQVYTFNNDGKTNVVAYKEDIPTWIDLNKDTGAIKINAPDTILNSESYKNTIKPLLTQLSSAYKTNKDYKMPNPFDENDKAEYSVEEVVRKIQDGINNQQIALGQYARTKDAVAQRIGEKAKDRLTPGRYAILMANGLSGRDDDIISVPKSVSQNLRWKNFFEMADSFNGTEITAKDFQDVYYHVDAGRDILNLGYDNAHEMKEWVRKKIAAMESMGVDNMSDEDFDEYLRLQAFNNYLTGTPARQDVVNSFIEQVWAVPEGFARGTANLTSGFISLADGVWNKVFGLEEGSEAYKRFGNPLSKDTEFITTIAANAVSIPTGGGMISSDDLVSTGHVSSELRKLYDERAQYYVDTNKDAATWFMISYAGTVVAENIITSKAVTSVALGAVARAAGIKMVDTLSTTAQELTGSVAFPEGIKNATEYMNYKITGVVNPNMYQLISGLSKTDPSSVFNMVKFTNGLAAATQNTPAYAAALKGALATEATAKRMGTAMTIADLTAQAFIDTALQDPVATRKIIEGSGTDEERAELWENAAWNFGGYAGGLLLGKMISAFPKSTAGQAANEAATRKLWEFEGFVSNKRDQLKEAMLGEDWLNNIKNPGKKQVARYKWIINKAGENIAKSGGDVASTLKGGKTGQTTAEAIRQMRAVENAISQREAGVGVKIREFRSDAHPSINNSIKQLESSTSELAKLLTDAGYKPVKSNVLIGGTDPNMGFTPELNNYAGSLYYKRVLDNKLKANNSVISYEDEKLVFPGTAKFTDAQKRAYPVLEANIKRYEEMFPKNITDYVKNTYIPNLYSASVAIRNYRMNPKVSLDLSEEIEGFISTGMWGEKGDEFIPMMRITEAQKEYAEELNRNFQKTEKTGFIRNRNKGPEAIQWGSEADFVNPTLAVERYLTQTAYEEINQSGLRTVLNTPTIKNNTLFNGEQTGAARTFKNLEPALDKAVNDGLGGVKTKFDKSYIADLVLSEYTVKADIAKAEAKQKRAEKELKKIAEEAPKINPIDRSRALQTMSNENITNVLNDAYKERAKSGGYLDGYKSAATIEDVLQDKSAYDKFILNSPIGVRRAIKRAVNSYSNVVGLSIDEISKADDIYNLQYISYEDILSSHLVGEDPSNEAADALRQYQSSSTGISAEIVNKFLINGRKNPKVDDLIDRLQNAFTKEIDTDVVLYSGISDKKQINDIIDNVGGKTKLLGFTSTSTDFDYAKTFADGDGSYVLRIYTPSGTKVAVMPENMVGANGELENEILFKNGLDVEVDRVHEPGEISEKGVIDLRVSGGKTASEVFNGTPFDIPNGKDELSIRARRNSDILAEIDEDNDLSWQIAKDIANGNKNGFGSEEPVYQMLYKIGEEQGIRPEVLDADGYLEEEATGIDYSVLTPEQRSEIYDAMVESKYMRDGYEFPELEDEFNIDKNQARLIDQDLNVDAENDKELRDMFSAAQADDAKSPSEYTDSINSNNNPYLSAPIDDPALDYDAFKLVTEINPDVITDVNRAMLKANKDAFKASDLITKIAQNQKKARIELAATIKFEEASRTLGLPTINSRAKLIGAIDDALDGVTKSILEDENAVKVLDAIMVGQDAGTDVSREYIAMVYLKKHEKEIQQAAQDVFKYDKFKNAAGKMPGTTIAKMENQLSKEIRRCIDSKLDDARNVFVAAGGEVVDGDKVLKEIHKLMDDIEEAGHDANVVAVRRNGQEELVETDPIVADVFNYHVIDESSNVEKFLNNPVFKGMNRLSRFFQVTVSPTSMRNQYIRDPLSMFVGTGGIPIRDGMKHISKELLATYDEQIVKEFSEMFPSEAKYIKENLKEGEKYEEKILESIMATGSSTSPALTKTAFYKDPFEGTNVSENFWGVLDQTKSTIGKIVNKAGDFTESAHQAREVYLRNAQYAKGLKDGLDAGMSLEDAMEMARFFRDNGTTNFRNELYHLRAFAKTVNYFGAAINGYTSFWRLFSLDPVGVSTRLFGGIIVPIIVATGMSLASDENRERYKGLKEYEKNEQFIFVMNGQVYRIPLPQELSVIINPIRHSVETLYGQDKHSFWELMMTDLLNIGPVKFGDIMDLDRNEFDPDPSILDRFGQLGLSLIDQTMPLAVKTIFSLATGIDTYTGQPIDTSYWSFDEDGNRILVGGTQSQFSLKLGKETGWSPSVIAWASKSLFGTVGRDVLDVVLGGASPTTLISNSLGAMSLTASDYDRTASDWNKKIADLWNQKEAKYLPMYNDYTDQINKENDPEKKQKLINKRKDEMKPFFDQVKNMVKTLNDKYPGMYDRYRFSAVTSLLIFDNGVASGTDAASKERDLQNFYLNRDRARQWMSDLGISASDSDSILGHLEMGKDGTIGVKINNPLEVLSAQSLFYGAKDQHVANITTILESGTDSYKNQLKEVKNQISEIYNKGKLTQDDYNRIDDIKIEWDKKVIAALAPYVEKYSAESAINNEEVLKYLGDYLYVPDAFKKNNRGYNVTNKSLNYLGNAEDAFKESFIKYAFGVNDNKYEHSWNFSNHKTLGGK